MNLRQSNYYDFLLYDNAQFQALSRFCSLSKSVIEQSITSFGLNPLLSPEILTKTVLEIYAESAFDQIQLSIANIFRSQLQLKRKISRGNQFEFYYGTYYFIAIYQTSNKDSFQCDCDVYLDCMTPPFIVSERQYTEWTIPGIQSGCSPITSILGSTLKCFYSQTCL
ncbi:hypothetical protein I4U23_021350 [Adineta vaga]|nr:hypothetical protein I4U23_021350 [Adineta vaga]